MNIKQKQSGFIVIEVLLIAIVALVILLVVWLIYDHNSSPSAVITQRQKYIDKTISGLNEDNYQTFGTTLYHRGYLTTSLYNTTQSLINSYANSSFGSNPAYSKLICVDEVPSSYSYGSVNVGSDGNSATIAVNVYEPGSDSPIPYTADWVKTNGSWQINNASCLPTN